MINNTEMHWDGTFYHNNSQYQHKYALEFLMEYDFRGNETVLDIGCGDGKITYEIALRVPHGKVIGIDYSDSMIEFAKKKYRETENLFYRKQDIQHFSLANQCDLVTSFFCLQWVPDKLAAFQNIRDTLKTSGLAILGMPILNQKISQVRKKVINKKRWQNYFADFNNPLQRTDGKAYKKFAEDVGLQIILLQELDSSYQFKDRETLTNFLTAISPHLSKLPSDSEKNDFMQEITQHYLDSSRTGNKHSFEVNFTLVKMHIRKGR